MRSTPSRTARSSKKSFRSFEIRTNTDDYQLISAEDNGRRLLFIAGGRPRALLYGVYHFFESEADCRYFWDGDIIPAQKTIGIEEIDIFESPRFEYRGLRYFAHRSLNRFQAEHWDFDEMKREIDWILQETPQSDSLRGRARRSDSRKRSRNSIIYPDTRYLESESALL